MTSPGEEVIRQRLQRVEALVERLERIADGETRDTARELMQTLLDLHRAGLSRMLDLAGQGEYTKALLDVWLRDDLIRNLFLLHGLHPVNLEQRVHQALDGLRPGLQRRGAGIELLAVTDGVVRLRLHETDAGHTGSLEDLGRDVEAALWDEVPDALDIAFEDSLSPRVSLPLIASHARGGKENGR